MTDKERIRAEVEKLKSEYSKESDFRTVRGDTAREVLDKLLSFIDSIPEEPANEDLEEAMEMSVSEEPLLEFFATGQPTIGAYGKDSLRNQFEAGAEWKEQQMMKDAVDGEYWDGSIYLDNRPTEYKDGDKVKIIIVKTEQQ